MRLPGLDPGRRLFITIISLKTGISYTYKVKFPIFLYSPSAKCISDTYWFLLVSTHHAECILYIYFVALPPFQSITPNLSDKIATSPSHLRQDETTSCIFCNTTRRLFLFADRIQHTA